MRTNGDVRAGEKFHEGNDGMIVCRDCGNANEEGDQFCGSCGSFLEWTGSATEETQGDSFAFTAAPTLVEKIKKAHDSDDDAVSRQRAEADSMERADAELARIRADELKAQKEAEQEAARQQAEDREREERARAELARKQQEELAIQKAKEQREAEAREAQLERQRIAAERQRAAEAEKRLAAEAIARADEQRKRLEEEAQQRESARQAAEQLRRQTEAEAQARARAAEAARLASNEQEQVNTQAEHELLAEQRRVEQLAAQQELERIEVERRHAEEVATAEAARVRANEELRRIEQVEREEQDRKYAEEQEKAAAENKRLREAEEDLRKKEELRQAAESQRLKEEAERTRIEEERDRVEQERKAKEDARRAEVDAAQKKKQLELQRAAALIAKPVAEHPDTNAATAASVGASTPRKDAKGSTSAQKPAKAAARVGEQAPGKESKKHAVRVLATNDINPGDLVCGQCGTGNPPARKFCKKCGKTLAEAPVATLGFFKRIARKLRRKPKDFEAGTRRRTADGRLRGDSKVKAGGRRAISKVRSTIARITIALGFMALLGLGVEPIRQKLHLPNVKQTAIQKWREFSSPIFDPIRSTGVTASSSDPKFPAAQVADLGSNTYWAAAPKGTGVGSIITFTFTKPVDLARLLITSGAFSDKPADFVNRPRASELRLRANGDESTSKTVKIGDKATPQSVNYVQKQVTRLDITVANIYPAVAATKLGVAITEIELFSKRKYGDDYETLLAKGPTGLADDDLATNWRSAALDDGVGSTFILKFAAPVDIDRLRFNIGLTGKDFASGVRPKEIQVVLTCVRTCPATAQIKLKDKSDGQSVKLVGRGVTSLQFQIRTVRGAGGPAVIREVSAQRLKPKTGS
jgi:hypothetical protein